MEWNTFKSKLHLACDSNELRPALQCIFFRNGWSYCTNGHLLIKQKLLVHGFSQEEIEFTEGHHIHRDIFKAMHVHKRIKIVKEGFEVDIEDRGTMLFRFSNTFLTPPNYEGVFPSEVDAITEITFDLKLIAKLQKILIFRTGANGGVDLKFYGSNKGMLITPYDMNDDQQALLMPLGNL